MNSLFISNTANITKIKNKAKSIVLISGIIRSQYLRRVAKHARLQHSHALIWLQIRYRKSFLHNSTIILCLWSDGCASQFRSKFIFALITNFNPDYTIQWYYNKCHHAKGPMDGTGRTVKNTIFQHVKSKKCVINGAKDFAEYANKIINGISCLYLAENEIMAEPQDIETSIEIPRTLKIHKVLRTYNEDNVCKMEFYELADKTDLFYIQCSGTAKRATWNFVGTISFH